MPRCIGKERQGIVISCSYKILHSCDSPHGPDAATFNKASVSELSPHWFDGGLAFMFESSYIMKLSDYALNCTHIDKDYYKCWQPLKKHFNPLQK